MTEYEKNCLLSIIIPVHNVEKYLERALSSVAGQTLDKRYFEVIIVDDASGDSSLKIARRYENRYSNFRVVALDEISPGGAGTASNIGIREARGRYVGFVDGDDWIEAGMFEKMLDKATRENADLVVCDFMEYDQVKGEILESYDSDHLKAAALDDFSRQSLLLQKKALLKLSPVPWGKLYLRSLLLEKQLYFPEGEFYFEDNPFHWFSILSAGKIVVLPEALIVHRKNRPGQTMDSSGEVFLAFMEHGKIIKAYLQAHNYYGDYREDFLYWLIIQSGWILQRMDSYLAGIFVKGVGRLLGDFSRADLVEYFHSFPLDPVRINWQITLIKGRAFIYSRRHIDILRFVSTIHTIFYIYGKRHGLLVIREQSLARLFREKVN